MKIKDILEITGGMTKVVIFMVKDETYYKMWKGIVDDISFPDVPYGNQKVTHMSVINDEDILCIVFDYKEPKNMDTELLKEFSWNDNIPFDWLIHLCLKYERPEKIVDIIRNDRDAVFKEVKPLE